MYINMDQRNHLDRITIGIISRIWGTMLRLSGAVNAGLVRVGWRQCNHRIQCLMPGTGNMPINIRW